MADGLDPTKILYCLYDPTSPDSVATAWVIRHVCQRDAISLELAAVDDTKPLSPDFMDRHVVIAGVRWSVAAVDLMARHAVTVVLFPTLNGFESYDALKTVPPYKDWTKDGYAITEIAPTDPQHVGKGYICREVGMSPQVGAWRFFRPGIPVPSFLTQPTTFTDPDWAFAAYDRAMQGEQPAGGSEPTLVS
jgi:hypothetical protein